MHAAGFDNQSHATLNANLLSESTSVAGSFLSNDDDTRTSLGEVYVETLLTPVTSARVLRRSGRAGFRESAVPRQRTGDAFVRPGGSCLPGRFRTARSSRSRRRTWSIASYRIRSLQVPVSVRGVLPTRRRSRFPLQNWPGKRGAADEERFGLQWRAVDQQGGREAIRSAVFRVDTAAARVARIGRFGRRGVARTD